MLDYNVMSSKYESCEGLLIVDKCLMDTLSYALSHMQ